MIVSKKVLLNQKLFGKTGFEYRIKSTGLIFGFLILTGAFFSVLVYGLAPHSDDKTIQTAALSQNLKTEKPSSSPVTEELNEDVGEEDDGADAEEVSAGILDDEVMDEFESHLINEEIITEEKESTSQHL